MPGVEQVAEALAVLFRNPLHRGAGQRGVAVGLILDHRSLCFLLGLRLVVLAPHSARAQASTAVESCPPDEPKPPSAPLPYLALRGVLRRIVQGLLGGVEQGAVGERVDEPRGGGDHVLRRRLRRVAAGGLQLGEVLAKRVGPAHPVDDDHRDLRSPLVERRCERLRPAGRAAQLDELDSRPPLPSSLQPARAYEEPSGLNLTASAVFARNLSPIPSMDDASHALSGMAFSARATGLHHPSRSLANVSASVPSSPSMAVSSMRMPCDGLTRRQRTRSVTSPISVTAHSIQGMACGACAWASSCRRRNTSPGQLGSGGVPM